MKQYLGLLRNILDNGVEQGSRATLLSTGEKPNTLSLFGPQCRYNLREGFPLVTTRKMSFKIAAVETAWYLRGESNVKYLQENGIHIWDEWSDSVGDLGWSYPSAFRNWEGVDQIANLVRDIRAVAKDPQHVAARRLTLTALNPTKGSQKAPVACHSAAMWYVHNGRLSCKLFQRSGDWFLGVGYNVACYALLTHLFAHITSLEVHDFIHSFGDLHLYEHHVDAAKEQLKRKPYPLPKLVIDPSIREIDDFEPGLVSLEGYKCHGSLKGEVAV